MKVAIVHDHLAQDGGAERVVRALHRLFPEAPIYVLVYNRERAHSEFLAADVRTSFIQRLPGSQRLYQWYLTLMPVAVERYDLREYDLVISSSASFAKGAITLPQTLHVSYIHSPTRYLWSDTIEYVNELPYPRILRSIAPLFLNRVRIWDRLAADRPDRLIANSEVVQRRIRKYYRRESDVIHPPVETSAYTVGSGKGGYYLAGGRLVPYKRIDLAIRAFNKLGLPLKIYGSGPIEKELREMARSNVEFLGRVPDAALNELYGNAVAYINPQEEDFGITAVESMATGRPVVAFNAGGARETVRPGLTGVLFDDQDWECLADAILHLKPETYRPQEIREWSEKFSLERFNHTFRTYIEHAWQDHQKPVS